MKCAKLPRALALTGILAAGVTSGAVAVEAPSGGNLYLENCAICHGEDGRGPTNSDYNGPMIVGNAFVRSQDDAKLISFLKRGRPADAPDSQMHILMPAFDYLGDKELALVIAFLRETAGGPR